MNTDNKEPIRVLQILPGGPIWGGIENFVMNYYRSLDRNRIQFDFLVHYKEKGHYDKEIEELGGRIYYFSAREDKKIFSYIRDLSHFFQQHPEYKIIHGHMPGFAPIYFMVAQKNGVPIRISHSHVTATEPTAKGWILNLIIHMIKYVSNCHWACSKRAGKYMYGQYKNFLVIPNAISIERFHFDEKIRDEMRHYLQLEEKFVVGNVGRFCPQKNQLFLLEVFAELRKLYSEAFLLLIGEGEMRKSISQKVLEIGIEDSVMILDNQNNIEDYYQVMDVLVMPSLFEGLPVTMVEAQACGVPCVVSSSVTDEAAMSNMVKYVSLSDGFYEWCEAIISFKNVDRTLGVQMIKKNGYEIHEAAEKLALYYEELMRKI